MTLPRGNPMRRQSHYPLILIQIRKWYYSIHPAYSAKAGNHCWPIERTFVYPGIPTVGKLLFSAKYSGPRQAAVPLITGGIKRKLVPYMSQGESVHPLRRYVLAHAQRSRSLKSREGLHKTSTLDSTPCAQRQGQSSALRGEDDAAYSLHAAMSFPRVFAFQRIGIMPPVSSHVER